MPNSGVFAQLLSIDHSSKALQTKFPPKRLTALSFQLRARRRNFDIESKSSRNGLMMRRIVTGGRGIQMLGLYCFHPFTVGF